MFLSKDTWLIVRLKDLLGKEKKIHKRKHETEPTRKKLSNVAKNEIRNGSNFVSFIFEQVKLKALKSCRFIFAMSRYFDYQE